MIRKLWLLALVGALVLSAAPVIADDGFYVIPTRATPGTSINSLPYTITAPGYYYLTRNLTYNGGTAITVDDDNVTLDLMGFCLTGPGTSDSLFGILIKESRHNVEVRNGTVSGWWVGILQDPEGTGKGTGQRVIGVRVVGNYHGILLGSSGTGHLIRGCTAVPGSFGSGDGLNILRGTGTIQGCTVINFNSGILIGSGTISDNVVMNCAFEGVRGYGPTTISHNAVINCTTGISSEGGGSIIGNVVVANTGQTGIKPNTSSNSNVLDQNSVVGVGIHYGSGGVRGLNGG